MSDQTDTRYRQSPRDDADDHNNDQTPSAGVALDPRPERRLLRARGDSSYLDVIVRVAESPVQSQRQRSSVHLALVIDCSGSMAGTKLETAKRAALAVLNGLSERDTIAVVVFGSSSLIVQKEAPVTPLVKAHVAAALADIDVLGLTALHEGWLEGCLAIASDSTTSSGGVRTGVRRCFLLTDGQANVGLTDPEALAQAAARVREQAGVSTSTFGIGDDYQEEVLGPMAEAGGGQFYHLRAPEEIATTFVGELEQLLGTLARDAHLEIEATPGITAGLVSAYPWRPDAPDTAGTGRWAVALGDLVGGEERHVVVSLTFPPTAATTSAARGEQTVRVRLTWQDDTGSHATAWQSSAFHYAESEEEYDAEAPDKRVLQYVAQHLSYRAQRKAILEHKHGDLERAQRTTQEARFLLDGLGLNEDDDVLASELQSLRTMQTELPDPGTLKERWYTTDRRVKGKPDLREGSGRPSGHNGGALPPPEHTPSPDDLTSGTSSAAGS